MSAPDHSHWSIHQLSDDHYEFLSALHVAITGRPQRPPHVDQEIHDLLESAAAGHIQIRPVIGAYRGGRLGLAVAGVESLGSSNLILLPFEAASPGQLEGATLALRRALRVSCNHGVTLSQVIGPEGPSRWDVALREAGMQRLTHLTYLTLRVSNGEMNSTERPYGTAEEWLSFSPETEPFFCEALQQSYLQSLDCPELTEMRSATQMLLAHRAAGSFDPAIWFVVMSANRPHGVLLLSRARRDPAMEIVYMGAAQVARGSGVADALMMKAIEVARQSGVQTLILAVDVRNEQAMRFYQRWKFQEVARRAAWIAKLCAAGG